MSVLVPPVSPNDHKRGDTTAEVTLVEYGDYQCPDCARLHPIVRELQERLDGRLCFVYRHFPRPHLHPDAQHAAEVAEAAANQGKFWEMHDCLYTNHHALGNGYLVEYAVNLGLKWDRFLAEVTGDLYVERVREHVESGRASGVKVTPTFFINGIRYEGEIARNSLLEALRSVRARTENESRT